MEPIEISKMRINQLLFTNAMMLTLFVLFFAIINIYTIRLPHFFLALGIVFIIQAIYGFIKADSTKSIIPLMERVAIYEKQKMGSEWTTARKVSSGWSIVLSGLMFFQFYMGLDYEDNIFHFDPIIMVIITCSILIIINIGMFLHFRKVDRTNSESDMVGYTWKTNVIAAVFGLIFGLLIFISIIYYVISSS